MHHPTDRIAHTTAFVTPVVEHWLEQEIAQWVYHMKDLSDDPSHHERTPLPRSYISLRLWLQRCVSETVTLCDFHLFPNLKGHLHGKHLSYFQPTKFKTLHSSTILYFLVDHPNYTKLPSLKCTHIFNLA